MKSAPNNNTTWRHLRRHVIKLVPSTVHATISLKQRKGLKFKTVKLPVLYHWYISINHRKACKKLLYLTRQLNDFLSRKCHDGSSLIIISSKFQETKACTFFSVIKVTVLYLNANLLHQFYLMLYSEICFNIA
jgi:predicted N-acyltransferase